MAKKGRPAADLYNNPLLSDVKIRQISKDGQVREYYGHKAILSGESRYFMAAFTGQFREASEATMEIHDDDPDHFEFILKYLYTHCFDAAAIKTLAAKSSTRRMTILLEIYIIADKYNLPNSIFVDIITDATSTLRILRGQHSPKKLLSLVPQYYGMIFEAAHPFGTQLVKEILGGEYRSETAYDDFTNMVKKYPVFGADVALQLAKERVSYYCQHCQVRNELVLPDTVRSMELDCPDCSGKVEKMFLSTNSRCP